MWMKHVETQSPGPDGKLLWASRPNWLTKLVAVAALLLVAFLVFK